MQPTPKTPTRKKFIWWGAALLASLAAIRWLPGGRGKKTETVKMLTQDGKLVEIDKKLLASSGKKITNQELQHWVKK